MGVFRNLRTLFSPTVRYVYGGELGVRVEDMDAAALYRTQPNLRAVISYLADNAAQVPLKVHERRGEADRPRVTDSAAALLMQSPNPDMTPFEFKRWVYSDLLLYERCVVLVLPSTATASGWELRPVPYLWVQNYQGASPFAPESIDIASPNNPTVTVDSSKFVLFHGYSPTDPARQCTRVASLIDTLHEQVESDRFRRQMWQRGGRFNAYLTRPKDVEPWSEESYERFRKTWQESWAGDHAGSAGGMPILEDGMQIAQVQFNSRDAQWSEAKKLGREDVAGVYHVNPALIWPGSGQTYASAKDNARALYNDTLAPLLMQVTDRLNHTVLPMVGEPRGNYVAYDITIKTEGTFEEKLAALQSAAGAPVITRNEARAKLDMPAVDGGDELITPLNVLMGGLAGPNDTDPDKTRYNSLERVNAARLLLGFPEVGAAKSADAPTKEQEAPAERKAKGDPADGDAERIADVYRRFFERQARSVVPKIEADPEKARNVAFVKDGIESPAWWNAERWDRELADDLYPVALEVSDAAGERAVAALWPDDQTRSYGKEQTAKYVRCMCEVRAHAVNATTLRELQDALEKGDGKSREPLTKGVKDTLRGVYEFASDHRALAAGLALAAAAVGFATHEAARQNKRRGENVYKTWRTTSGNPRSTHRALNGETVQMDESFSNGMQWPGDWHNGSAAEVAFCKCKLDVEVREKSGQMRETARSVADELGLSDDYDPAHVYAAYGACQETIGLDAAEWATLNQAQRELVIAELRTRDREWVAKGKVPKPTFNPRSLEYEKIREGKAHEIETAKRVNKHGVRSDFVIDEVQRQDPLTKRMQTIGLADFADGTEIKTLLDASTYSTIDGYLKSASGKENATRVIFDNSSNDAMTDEFLIECINRSRRFKRGSVYVLTHDERYLKIR